MTCLQEIAVWALLKLNKPHIEFRNPLTHIHYIATLFSKSASFKYHGIERRGSERQVGQT